MKRAIILAAVTMKAAILALAIGAVSHPAEEVDLLACIPCADPPECPDCGS